MVGMLESCAYRQGTARLAPGDLLVAFTDGVSEAMNRAEDEWGEDCLIKSIRPDSGQAAKQMLRDVMDAVDAFVAGAPQHDDMTLVVLRTLP